MAIRIALNHKTAYTYDRPVTLQPQVIRLRPAPHCRTPIIGYSLKVSPEPHFLNWQQDAYSNYLARVVFPKPARTLTVEVDLVAEMTAINPFDFFIDGSAEKYPFVYDAVMVRELVPYLETEPAGPLLQELAAEHRRPADRTIDHLVAVNQHLQKAIRYVIRLEPGIQSTEETLLNRSGSCRDSAWVLVQVLRHLGLAARFVSGYLIQLTADIEPLDGPPGPAKDFTDLHAWAEVYLPGAGWVGLDPTSGLLASEGHIPLACAADPIAAAPITGSFTWNKVAETEECREDFRVHMTVARLRETPRVTKPYTEEQWQAIDRFGHQIDQELSDNDVRLTLGGEPTFVAIDDRDAPEWNMAAVGPTKRGRAGDLLLRLRDRFAPGGLLHFGQGKWYPGESLPRWALGCWWRRDGEPLWRDPGLIASETRSYGHGSAQAYRFLAALAERLRVSADYAHPGYEDIWHYLLRERQLPVNVDPLRSQLADPEERARLARIFDQGLGKIIGYALPLRREHAGPVPRWVSGPWFLRRDHLFLVPGDSPMGFRLPLESLPWEPPEAIETQVEPDPWAVSSNGRRQSTVGPIHQMTADGRKPSADGRALAGVVRTAICVEPRDGRLYVFMPPLTSSEDYLDLVAIVEDTAAALRMPVLLEGYPPPADYRLSHFLITPDPGVIEVNVHPAASWTELVKNTTTLYEEARQARLTTEKFMIDGRHVGTGGGNHVIIGGPTPADSPVLRRPDLLRSMLGFWHNHPALSYLFSGLFVGPTSQAPRIDARNDSLYELEIAFRQLPSSNAESGIRHAEFSPHSRSVFSPWLVDRVFRHLLADVSGNTHRAEFCIDKLYSPDTPSGRRGLVELRSFEMPPHSRMSLVQQLLLRSLVAWFWREPYDRGLVRWGPELHDRFMLPHFVEQDFRDVLGELRRAGYPLRDEWFAPHHEFRFPPLGTIAHRGLHLELRTAIEPWHVLGEEPAGGATARYVDTSVERLQVKVQNLTDPRHVITCNGRRVPLAPTGTNGEYVAGVRYRAWQPPSCLHPTIPVHTPLVFDIHDTWQGRSLGGCTYHVSHPGGLAHETLPVNANEAEGRRISRFFAFGHTPGPWTPPAEDRRPESPLTLDLRWPCRQTAISPAVPEEIAGFNGIMRNGGPTEIPSATEPILRR